MQAQSGRTARWTAPSAPPRAAPPGGCRQNAGPGDAGQARGNGGAWASSPAARSAHPGHVRQDLRLTVGRDHHGACTPSGPGQHGRDGERNGAGTLGEAAAGSNDRTSGSASWPAGAARPGKRRRAAPPSRRPPANHPPPAAVNRHYFSLPRPIPGHPGSMHPPTVRGSLPASTRSVQRLAARLSGAIAVAVDLPAIAVAAHHDLAAAPHAHEQTARPRGLTVIAGAA
jgi:hypothetical protein